MRQEKQIRYLCELENQMKAFFFLAKSMRKDNRKVLKCQLGLKYVYAVSRWIYIIHNYVKQKPLKPEYFVPKRSKGEL